VGLGGGGPGRRSGAVARVQSFFVGSAARVTASPLGGPPPATLFITTSRQGVADGGDPQAGSLFACEPGVVGLPVVPFAG
jgi:sugar lactone lactonase YvrE